MASCSPGKKSASEGQTICATCALGQTSAAGANSCSACDPGYKCTGGSAKVPCPAGKSSGASASVCLSCDPGKYQPLAAQSICGNCPTGKVSANSMALACDVCSVGQASGASKTTCSNCPANTYSIEGNSACTNCDAGYTCSNGQRSPCPAGKHSAAQGSCTDDDCTAGSFCPGNANIYSCIAGTYSEKGAAFCVACTAGTWSAATATICTVCPKGTYSLNGAASQGECDSNKCLAGEYCLFGVKNKCPVGKYSTGSASECSLCQVNNFCDGITGTQTACPAGQEQQSLGQSSCTNCAPGKWRISETTCSRACPQGYYCTDGSKTGCPSGKTTSGTHKTSDADCTDCTAGSKCNSSTGHLESPCIAGKYSLVGQSECQSCPNGKYVTGTGSSLETDCTENACTQHSICVDGIITACASGKDTAAAGSEVCSTCPNAKYSSSGAACLPTSCSGGSYCIGGVKHLCPAGKYSTGSVSSCTNCPDGEWSIVGTTSLSPGCSGTLCGAGYFCYRGFRSACASGKYSPAGAIYGHQCLDDLCAAGKYCVAGATTQCQFGKYSTGGSSECTFCPPGKYIDSLGSSSSGSCGNCGSGHYCIRGKKTPCAVGQFSSGTQNVVCIACEDGYTTSTSGKSSCDTPCPGGHYCANGINTKCPTGKWSLISSKSFADCAACPDGKSTVTMTPTSTPASEIGYCTSINCAVGSYCVGGIARNCPEGKFTLSTGSVACEGNCPNGKYSAKGAATANDCTVSSCTAGYYCTDGVKTACPDGKWSNSGSLTSAECTEALCTAQGSGIQCQNGHIIGAVGPAGSAGPAGGSGAAGTTGAAGTAGSAGTAGTSGTSGTDGSSGASGTAGTTATGSTKSSGPSIIGILGLVFGILGSILSVIALCKGRDK